MNVYQYFNLISVYLLSAYVIDELTSGQMNGSIADLIRMFEEILRETIEATEA